MIEARTIVDELVRSVRDAVRFLGRTPAFTLPAVASLALGIAVNTTLFSVFDAVLLRPLGSADDLVRIGRTERGQRDFRSASYEEFTYLRENASSLADLIGHQLETVPLAGPDGSYVVSAEFVAGNYFTVLGSQPALGRGFSDEDESPAATATVVISDRFWRRQFATDRAVVGTTVSLAQHPFTVIGVAPAGFVGTFPGVDIDIWLPAQTLDLIAPPTNQREPLSLMLIGRLAQHVSITAAETELQGLAVRLAGGDVERARSRSFVVAPARGVHPLFANVLRIFLSLMMAIVAVVLLIACANVAGMLLARASARRGELAVRLACGASRRRVVALLLVEATVLAALGGGAGLLIAFWALRVLNGLELTAGPTGTGIFFNLQLHSRVLLFTVIATTLTALSFGLLPALQATRGDLAAALRGSQTVFGRTRSRLRGALVVVQITLSFVLLVGAMLLFRSLHHASTLAVGFDPDQVVIASFEHRTLGDDRGRLKAFHDELLRHTRSRPGVASAAFADFVPLSSGGNSDSVTVSGSTMPDPGTVYWGRVSNDYFTTVRQPLARGRAFTDRDMAGAPLVAIVNEAFVRRYWPDADALGQRIRLAGDAAEREIVGVVHDARYASLRGDIAPLVYLPLQQRYTPNLTLYVRTVSAPAEALADLGRIVHEIDGAVALNHARTLRDAVSFALVPARVGRAVFGVAGVIALLLASGGLYGLVCYTLERRLKEIGIRVALGASGTDVFRVIVGNAVALTALGVALGVAVAGAATRLLSALLYGLSPTDPVTFAASAVLLLCATLGAGYAGARKGLRVDPMLVLRHD